MLKKLITSVLVVLTLFIFTMPTAAESNYTDVTEDDWYFDSLGTMSDNNIITGFPDGSFQGSGTLNRDQYLAMLCRLIGEDPGVADVYWAQNYIDKALQENWLNELEGEPYNLPITRYEAALLTSRALATTAYRTPGDLASYDMYVNDFNSIPDIFTDGVLTNVAAGIITGYPDGSFQGDNTLTRAEGAVMSHRFFDPTIRQTPLSPSKVSALKDALQGGLSLGSELTLEDDQLLLITPDMEEPITFTDTDLETDVAVVSENILVDALTEVEEEVVAGYSYGLFNINLLSEEEESLLLYTASDGSTIITIDLLMLVDDEGELSQSALDMLLLICQNIDFDNADDMYDFILEAFVNRNEISNDGTADTIGGHLLTVKSQIDDHNILKITINVRD